MKIKDIIKMFDLEPLTIEGGYFRRTYTSIETLENSDNNISSTIFYLITPENFSSMHKLIRNDEIFHFYHGDPIEMLMLHENGKGEVVTISNDPDNNFNPQHIVPKGTWQGSRLISGGKYALLGVTVAPAYIDDDFIVGDRHKLINKYPDFEKMIIKLTEE